MRVCQPGPVARQRAITSAGSRRLISWRGFAERGRPPRLTTAQASISSVSSGSSSYSASLTTCASTRAKLEPKVRREGGLLTIVGLSHAEDVANRATRGVADNYEPASKQTEAQDSAFTILLARVLDLDRQAREDFNCVFEVQPALGESLVSFSRVLGDAHVVIVSTIMSGSNRRIGHWGTIACACAFIG